MCSPSPTSRGPHVTHVWFLGMMWVWDEWWRLHADHAGRGERWDEVHAYGVVQQSMGVWGAMMAGLAMGLWVCGTQIGDPGVQVWAGITVGFVYVSYGVSGRRRGGVGGSWMGLKGRHGGVRDVFGVCVVVPLFLAGSSLLAIPGDPVAFWGCYGLMLHAALGEDLGLRAASCKVGSRGSRALTRSTLVLRAACGVFAAICVGIWFWWCGLGERAGVVGVWMGVVGSVVGVSGWVMMGRKGLPRDRQYHLHFHHWFGGLLLFLLSHAHAHAHTHASVAQTAGSSMGSRVVGCLGGLGLGMFVEGGSRWSLAPLFHLD